MKEGKVERVEVRFTMTDKEGVGWKKQEKSRRKR